MVALRRSVTNRAKKEHERGQPLLSIHKQEGRDIASSLRNGRQDDAAEEMTRMACCSTVGGPRVLFQDVAPQQAVICHSPGVLALPQRHPELLLALDKLLEVCLAYLHRRA